jgi:hypothetical protein
MYRLFVVDNEACTLRAINLIEGYTKTVLGQDEIVSGQDSRLLEGYGDVDTSGFKAKTQVCVHICLYTLIVIYVIGSMLSIFINILINICT